MERRRKRRKRRRRRRRRANGRNAHALDISELLDDAVQAMLQTVGNLFEEMQGERNMVSIKTKE